MNRRTRTILATVALTGAVFAVSVGCSDDSGSSSTGDERSTASEAPPTTSERVTTTAVAPGSAPTSTPTSSSGATADASPLDWDGARFDVGAIERVEPDPAGDILVFDRWGVDDGEGLGVFVSGPELSEEPIVAFNTDSPWSNESTTTRRMRLAAGAEWLVMDRSQLEGNCDGSEGDLPEPVWRSRPIGGLAEFLAADESLGGQTTLTYDANGLVSLVRVTYGC